MSEEGSSGVYAVLDSGDQDLIDDIMGMNSSQIAGRILSFDPIWKAKNTEAREKIKANPACKSKISESIRKMHLDPVFKAKYADGMKKIHADPVFKAKVSERMKKMRSDPVFNAKLAESMQNTSKPVICIETGIFYSSSSKAGMMICININSIRKVCKGIRKTAGGYHWRYATPEEITKFRQDQEKDKS